MTQQLSIPKQVGDYHILHRIGGGGMAEVYLAELRRSSRFAKRFAVKLVRAALANDPTFRAMFIREAEVGSKLSHANIVNTLDFGETGKSLYMVMEYVSGPTLDLVLYYLREVGAAIPLDVTLRICVGICLGLEHAHSAADDEARPLNVVHRDLKPSNIFLARDGTVKVGDFGVARLESHVENEQGQNTTMVGQVKGTVRYMAPEQAYGEKVDYRADLFSVGALLFELLTLKPLYTSQNEGRLLREAQDAEVDHRLSLLPDQGAGAELRALLKQLLARAPEERPSSALEVVEALERIRATLETATLITLRGWLKDLVSDSEGRAEAHWLADFWRERRLGATDGSDSPTTGSGPGFKRSPSTPGSGPGFKRSPSTPGSGPGFKRGPSTPGSGPGFKRGPSTPQSPDQARSDSFPGVDSGEHLEDDLSLIYDESPQSEGEKGEILEASGTSGVALTEDMGQYERRPVPPTLPGGQAQTFAEDRKPRSMDKGDRLIASSVDEHAPLEDILKRSLDETKVFGEAPATHKPQQSDDSTLPARGADKARAPSTRQQHGRSQPGPREMAPSKSARRSTDPLPSDQKPSTNQMIDDARSTESRIVPPTVDMPKHAVAKAVHEALGTGSDPNSGRKAEEKAAKHGATSSAFEEPRPLPRTTAVPGKGGGVARRAAEAQRPVASSRSAAEAQRPVASSRNAAEAQRPVASSRNAAEAQRPVASSRNTPEASAAARTSRSPQGEANPASGRPGGINPAAGRPGGINPAAGRPGGINPASGRPGGINPASGRPGGMKPSAGRKPPPSRLFGSAPMYIGLILVVLGLLELGVWVGRKVLEPSETQTVATSEEPAYEVISVSPLPLSTNFQRTGKVGGSGEVGVGLPDGSSGRNPVENTASGHGQDGAAKREGLGGHVGDRLGGSDRRATSASSGSSDSIRPGIVGSVQLVTADGVDARRTRARKPPIRVAPTPRPSGPLPIADIGAAMGGMGGSVGAGAGVKPFEPEPPDHEQLLSSLPTQKPEAIPSLPSARVGSTEQPQVPSKEEPPKKARISAVASLPGWIVTVDGSRPESVELSEGDHLLVARDEKGRQLEFAIPVREGESLECKVDPSQGYTFCLPSE